MKKTLALLLVLAVPCLFAVEAVAKKDPAELSGQIEIVKADPAKKEKYDTVLLKVGEDTYKLIPGKDKKLFQTLEKLGGKAVAVKGELMPAKPPRFPLAAVKVDSFEEKAAEAATEPAAAPAPTPAAIPADVPAATPEAPVATPATPDGAAAPAPAPEAAPAAAPACCPGH